MKKLLFMALASLFFSFGFAKTIDLDDPIPVIYRAMHKAIRKDHTEKQAFVYILNDLIGDPSYTINHRIKMLRVLAKIMKLK